MRHSYEIATYTPGSADLSKIAGSLLIPQRHASSYAVSVQNDRTGTYLRVRRIGTTGYRTLFTTNTFLRGIGLSPWQTISYTSVDGKPQRGCVVLPLGYRRGKRHPAVVQVYPGRVFPSCNDLDDISDYTNLQLQLLAAHGYAVLLPSMPLRPQDNYDSLSNGVLPAMDRLAELGIADPNRFAVMGHSYGGYATLGLIEQTDRFKAAIACAGVSDLSSDYGVFNRVSYLNGGTEMEDYLWSPYWAEEGQGGLASPPWVDPQRYLRNSPITYADRVHTPVLIIHGDNDEAVPIQQSEEFFTALYRQGKRAEFVRYWGEGHVISGEANVKDLWRRVFSWLDRYDK